MQDIFNDMDKVIAKFSDDMREVFKNYHREEVKEEVFPKLGDEYMSVDSTGVIIPSNWGGDGIDNYRIKTNNVFKTREEAEQHRRFLLADAKLRKMADGGDWVIGYKIEEGVFYSFKEYIELIFSPYRFSSEEKANQAIKEIGKDDLKLIFGIKE